jgi:hypothetical protein
VVFFAINPLCQIVRKNNLRFVGLPQLNVSKIEKQIYTDLKRGKILDSTGLLNIWTTGAMEKYFNSTSGQAELVAERKKSSDFNIWTTGAMERISAQPQVIHRRVTRRAYRSQREDVDFMLK